MRIERREIWWMQEIDAILMDASSGSEPSIEVLRNAPGKITDEEPGGLDLGPGGGGWVNLTDSVVSGGNCWRKENEAGMKMWRPVINAQLSQFTPPPLQFIPLKTSTPMLHTVTEATTGASSSKETARIKGKLCRDVKSVRNSGGVGGTPRNKQERGGVSGKEGTMESRMCVLSKSKRGEAAITKGGEKDVVSKEKAAKLRPVMPKEAKRRGTERAAVTKCGKKGLGKRMADTDKENHMVECRSNTGHATSGHTSGPRTSGRADSRWNKNSLDKAMSSRKNLPLQERHPNKPHYSSTVGDSTLMEQLLDFEVQQY
jgi:hypothetical protein